MSFRPEDEDEDDDYGEIVRIDDEDCDSCMYWSVGCASSIGCGPFVALCLNPLSPKCKQMTYDGCEQYHGGRPIDEPRGKQ